jgi:hypothetical protein
MASNRLRSESGHRRLLVAAVISLALVAPAQAEADDPPPEDIPAVGAYVELVPAAGGSRQAGRRERQRGLPLPTGVRRRLDQVTGSDAPVLERVATAPDLGAPTRRLPLREPPPGTGATETSVGASLESVGQTLAGGSDRRLLLLVAAMVAITIGGLVATFRRASS